MKERNDGQEKAFSLPPSWCGRICRNAMSEKCVTFCAVHKNTSHFELKKGINLIDYPRFPIHDFPMMSKHEKATCLAVYVSGVVDHLQGVTNEPEYPPLPRSDPYSRRSFPIPENVKIQDILPHIAEEVSALSDPEKRESENLGSSEVAGTSD